MIKSPFLFPALFPFLLPAGKQYRCTCTEASAPHRPMSRRKLRRHCCCCCSAGRRGAPRKKEEGSGGRLRYVSAHLCLPPLRCCCSRLPVLFVPPIDKKVVYICYAPLPPSTHTSRSGLILAYTLVLTLVRPTRCLPPSQELRVSRRDASSLQQSSRLKEGKPSSAGKVRHHQLLRIVEHLALSASKTIARRRPKGPGIPLPEIP